MDFKTSTSLPDLSNLTRNLIGEVVGLTCGKGTDDDYERMMMDMRNE